ncbi:multiple sugar transport system permease protein [Ardenticatena maritima]|uniref:Multiple sugar transport system permease protein n=1 Tax=Ardenticatena maritima TaxID=872965 RepID=A0A0N0RFP5_9CHLR|nr:sugar ABC transporter permease [Ardenticatena maritima]KPL89339.1 hypothetical protein SE16_02440 [Ardenticatena maritima]GAP63750.1 multiple sugar transport system permease protein [Ardenticatena maritima]
MTEHAPVRDLHWSYKIRRWEPYLLLIPSFVYLLLFFAWPMLQALRLALVDESGAFTLEFVRTMVTHARFGEALRTTLLLIVAILPLQFFFAVVMALLVNAKLKGSSVFLYFYAVPLAISDLAAGIIWFAIFTQRGYLNTILQYLGILDRPFIFLAPNQRFWLITAIVLAEVWRATAIVMVILVAGLQSIPNEYMEAAEVFGAGLYDRVTKIILPLLKPSLQVALILRTILAFQAFAVVVALAGSGATVLAKEAFDWYVSLRNPHVAAAYAGLILILSIATTALYLRFLRTPEEMVL